PLYQYIHLVYSLSASFSSSKLQVSSLPTPMFNVFNGGKHADTNLDFQEFMLVPLKQTKFSEKVRMGSEIFHTLGKVLLANNLDTDVGNEGGYAPDIDSSVEAVEYIMEAITKAGYKPGKDVGIGIDVGAQELYNKAKKRYIFELDDCELTSDQLISLYKDWLKDYPIVSIEDGLGEDDWTNWKQMTRELLSQKNIKTFPPKADLLQGRMGLWSKPLAEKQKNKKQKRDIMLIGDDLFVTNIERVRKAIDRRIANAVLIKPNQVGTLTQAIECVKVSQEGGYKVVVSHRSGETGDDFIADLAVAIGADYFKAGSLSRGERVVKYNRIMAIEEELG
ncbi:hypothetical protein L6279_02240, partial [Candidatus Parcubacteria bacterium]|nr:hypothetical protein [Candidatus Parcubacteria bacterium]